ncbi:MAG TPA: right-handed parallel beta-helix repeat-containing protein [Allosphingosinicella sp.]|nr:right-handed parallel beta-helix repeat-containing protein [Allosphingosinicella sp.]
MTLTRRHLLETAGFGGVALCLPSWTGRASAATGALTPEQFGAKGDGRTNDSAAFAALAAEVNRRGGGEVQLRRAVYIVGRQTQAFQSRASYAFEPAKIMEFVGLSGPLTIRGNGAVLRCARGLRYGTFNPVTGAKTVHLMPHTGSGERSTPYRWMILAQDCRGPVDISDFELDGNIGGQSIGGTWGDTGWQIPAGGIALINNRGSERLSRIHSHHHGQDGLYIDGVDASRSARSLIARVRCEYNGRQGCSVVGGRGYDFRDCQFNHTGRANVASAPGAGVDIEAEAGKKVRDISFSNCTFSNNMGQGMVADSGDSEGVDFTSCIFIGTTNWSAWPNKPRYRFNRCTFVGPIVQAYGHAQPERACQFYDCTFRDDLALAPGRQVYGGSNTSRPIADLPSQPNILFSRCRFQLTHDAVLPWTTKVIYSDCTMSQRSNRVSYPRGTWLGRSTLTGRATISGSNIRGELIFNGTRMTGRVG